MEFDQQFIDVNLERFNPEQFDKSFSLSDDSSITEMSFRSNDTEKALINELEKIGKVVGAIETHLAYKDLNIKSEVDK